MPRKRQKSAETPAETPVEIPGETSGETGEQDIFARFEGLDVDNLKFQISRKREEGRYYQVAVMEPPCSWIEVKEAFGGGVFKVVATSGGKYAGAGTLYIDPDQYPPKTGKPSNLPASVPGVSAIDTRIDRLTDTVNTLAMAIAQRPQETEEMVYKRLAIAKELFSNNIQANPTAIFDVFSKGVDFGRDSSGHEKNVVDILDKHLPSALDAVRGIVKVKDKELNLVKANGHKKPARRPVKTPGGPEMEFVDNIFKGAVSQDQNFDFYADYVDRFAPMIIKHQIYNQRPEAIISYLANNSEKYKRLLDQPPIRDWIIKFINYLQNPEPEQIVEEVSAPVERPAPSKPSPEPVDLPPTQEETEAVPVPPDDTTVDFGDGEGDED
jgi:hypothetical protein